MEEKKYLMQLKKISVEELKLVPHILVINENGNGSNGFILRLFNILKTKYGKSILRTELPFDTESTIEDFFDDLYTILLNNYTSKYEGILIVDISSWKKGYRNNTVSSFLNSLLGQKHSNRWLCSDNIFFVFEVNDLTENPLVEELKKIGATYVIETESECEEECPLEDVLISQIGLENINYLKQQVCGEKKLFQKIISIIYMNGTKDLDKAMIDEIIRENKIKSNVMIGFRGCCE